MQISLRRLTQSVILGGLLAILIIACNTTNNIEEVSHKSQNGNCRIVRHIRGETCVPQNPQRIITLTEEILANSLALGVKPIASAYIVGYPLVSYLQDKVDGIESVGGYGSPNLEKILKLKPDLILADSYNSNDFYDQLSYIAPTVILNMPFPPLSWKEQLKELAQALGKEERGQRLIDRYWQRVEELKQALGDRRHTLHVSIASDIAAYQVWINGEKHFSGEVLKDVGLQRPPAQQGSFYQIYNIPEEKLSIIDGDVLFFIASGTEEDLEAVEDLKQKALWQKLSVVQRNQVYFVSGHWSNGDVFAVNAIVDDLFKYLVNSP